MGILHRFHARRAAAVWETETRLMRRLGMVRAPSAVQWIATQACDLTCGHCYSNAGRAARGELTAGEARRHIVDELVKLDRPTLVIAGGEPLLRRDLPGIIAYAAERRVPWAMHTHGGYVARHEALFRECPPLMVAVSLDGPRSLHDRFRGKPGSFDAALDAVARLKSAGVNEVVLGTTVNRHNADHLPAMVGDVMASGADSWGLHLVAPEGRAGDSVDLMPHPEQLRRVAGLARRLRHCFHVEMDNEWGSAGENDIFYREGSFLCGAGRFTCVVSATGRVMPCTTTDPAEAEGDVRREPLSAIWRRGFGRFRRGGCGGCSDGAECWLQTRHGREVRQHAFTPAAIGGEA